MNYNGEIYQIFSNGTVINSNGKVIVTEGGMTAAIEKLTPKYTNYTINGKDTYRIYKNGTVTTEDGSEVIVSTGG